MYAPYRFPGASVKFVPFHATIPPPQARFARVTFSNQLHVSVWSIQMNSFGGGTQHTLCQIQKRLMRLLSQRGHHEHSERLTICLAEYNTVHDIRRGIAASIPRVLKARKSTAVE